LITADKNLKNYIQSQSKYQSKHKIYGICNIEVVPSIFD